jgi:short-subunit dehydrogenase
MGAMSSAEVAGQGYRAMHAGKSLVVHGLKNKLGIWSVRFSPRSISRAIAASLNKSPAAEPQLKG